MATEFRINGRVVSCDAPAETPLLWVIREQLKLTGTKFGCGAGLCGACMVHIDGERAFSCQTQISEVAGRAVTTIEGLSPDSSHTGAEGLAGRARAPMRLLPVWTDHERRQSPQAKAASGAERDRCAYEYQHLSLWNLSADSARD
jgi:2Fe-2S iron-sulfur cluster binding domain